jgi:small subunit ribosomal protein S8
MVMTDPIADMITRIRNAQKALKKTCDIPHSRFKWAIASVLRQEGYIFGFDNRLVNDKKVIRIYLKYINDRTPIIEEIKKMSKPGKRLFVTCDTIPRIRGGLGIAVLSTSSGVMSGQKAREKRIGGELLFTIH